ncbi:Eco57I restriction-modification methylase domain-containing protein [Leptolyngbya sp. KIOST-1]|uniref:Eco57I restriction-modification methylase domain-containing protein n=1 Tax=Leptolyngbya sp. KIOST-1 TaxID=1229172 RepID=UPI000ABD1F94|nr:N-6 DNA methylase [Leptolyngbya sp. KIOST-1]
MSAPTATLAGLQIEGNLIASDLMADVLSADIKGQVPEAFGLQKTDKLADEIALAWGDAKIYWAAFQRALSRLPEQDLATTVTREQWAVPLLRSLGYDPIYVAKAEVVDEQTYAISHRAEPGDAKPPIHIVGSRVRLEQRPPSGTPRLSAHALVQDYLNRTEHLWAIATNGLRWRLLRDSSLMTRLTYVEFDLEQILNGENFAEFGLFYRLFHRSRLPQGMEDADKCLLEFYHQESVQQGGRVRDRLRDGVEQALKVLGTGFLQHPNNEALRQRLWLGKGEPISDLPSPPESGAGGEGSEGEALTETAYYRQLLLLIYRLLFLMVAESRNLLLSGDDVNKSRIYREYYSIERLRALAEKASWRREGFQDQWQGLRVTFRLFDENWRGQVLGLSPLNGVLFGSHSLLDIDACAIDNHDLTLAIRHLSLYEQRGQLRRVNYGALDVEELGSVYESLLDFHPQVAERQGIYEFQLVTGSDRKTTGSYYTPPELVGQLIKSALEPVIADRLEALGKDATLEAQEQALLSLKVCDPACGSGHFLLAASRRIGKELARIRTGEPQPGPEPLRVAIRDVIQHCVYGVDLNPLAVDLCKVALWIEGLCCGVSLNFLDHRIKNGNSLVGVLDLDCLKEGIPDNAYKPVTGDDKSLATQFKKRNKQERESKAAGQLALLYDNTFERDREEYAKAWREIEGMKDDDPTAVRQKQEKYERSRHLYSWRRDKSACNLWTAAFFMPLTEQNLQLLPTSAVLDNLLKGNWATKEIVAAADRLAEEKQFFHWPLEFPEVFEQGGFDCVLGNPPWERIKLQEKEFFGARDAEISEAKNKAKRSTLIQKLRANNPRLAEKWFIAKHDADAQGKFIRNSCRFPLTATGDINTYAIFSETARDMLCNLGRLGIIVPTGIATDDTCKSFFGDLVKKENLASIYDFENKHKLFHGVDSHMRFSLLGINKGKVEKTIFSFFLALPRHMEDEKRTFSLTPKDISIINPNTLTCPNFRTKADAELTKRIYQQIPVIENESLQKNPWKITFKSMFHMSNDSGLFEDKLCDDYLPLYEAKMFHIYNHRFAHAKPPRTDSGLRGSSEIISEQDLKDTTLTAKPRYFIRRKDIEDKMEGKFSWILAIRKITGVVSNERTVVAALLPQVGLADSATVMISGIKKVSVNACLLGAFNSLIFDYVARQKVGGVNLNFFLLKQFPLVPPSQYSQADIDFIAPRVLELTYTAWDLQPFAQDMGYHGDPFIWNPDRRAHLRAELDAYYAHLYGLTRNELRYILDPADIHGPDFPSETFRVLKNNEMKQFGEYRTQRLVLEAWNQLFGEK